MSVHLTDNEIESYRRNTLPVDRLLDFDSHLAECSECRERAITPLNVLSVTREIAADPEHLAYEQLESYVDGNIDPVDREIVETHLGLCELCQMEARELTALRAELSTYPAREYSPAAHIGPIDRIRSLMRIPAVWVPATAVSAAAASALLMFWMNSRPLQTRLAGSREEIARLSQSLNAIERANRDLARQTASLPDLQRRASALQTDRDRIRKELDRARKSVQVAAVELRDGSGGIARDAHGNLIRVESIPANVADALRTGKVKIPDRVASLGGREGVLMGVQNEFRILSPKSTAVLSDRPSFKWHPKADATGYVVSVYDRAGREIVHSSVIRAVQWMPDRSIPRGEEYTWEVVARNAESEIGKAPAPPASPAKFFVLTARQASEIALAQRQYSGSPLILGIRYAEVGLLEEADQTLKTVLKQNPGSALAKSLLANVEARGRGNR